MRSSYLDSFACIGYLNVLEIYPAKIVPIFQKNHAEGNELYYQILDSQGLIIGFRQLELSLVSRVIQTMPLEYYHWIGRKGLFGVASSPQQMVWAEGIDDFRSAISEVLATDYETIRSNTPIFGVEASILVGHKELEVSFAVATALKISATSQVVARLWLKGAPISEVARESALNAVNSIQPIESELHSTDSAYSFEIFETIAFKKERDFSFPKHLSRGVIDGLHGAVGLLPAMAKGSRINRVLIFIALKEIAQTPSQVLETLSRAPISLVSFGSNLELSCPPGFHVFDIRNTKKLAESEPLKEPTDVRQVLQQLFSSSWIAQPDQLLVWIG